MYKEGCCLADDVVYDVHSTASILDVSLDNWSESPTLCVNGLRVKESLKEYSQANLSFLQ